MSCRTWEESYCAKLETDSRRWRRKTRQKAWGPRLRASLCQTMSVELAGGLCEHELSLYAPSHPGRPSSGYHHWAGGAGTGAKLIKSSLLTSSWHPNWKGWDCVAYAWSSSYAVVHISRVGCGVSSGKYWGAVFGVRLNCHHRR